MIYNVKQYIGSLDYCLIMQQTIATHHACVKKLLGTVLKQSLSTHILGIWGFQG